jgi:serine/threonine-protein kinase RsbW
MSAHAHSLPNAVGGPTVRLTIPAKPEYITLVRLALSGLSRLRPLNEETLGDLKLAVTEACSNSVRHGYGDAGEGTVEILYELHPDKLVVEVADDGPGFDAQGERPDEENLEEGGLGIAIIRALSDEFEAGERSNGHGSRLRFVKFLDS